MSEMDTGNDIQQLPELIRLARRVEHVNVSLSSAGLYVSAESALGTTPAFFETTLAVCEKNVAFKQAVINAFVETIDFSGPRTRFHIQPWADGYESSSSSEDDEWIDRLLSPQAMEEAIERAMKEEAARKAREQERVDAIIAARTVHRIE